MLSESLLEGKQLAEIPSVSKYLTLFDSDRKKPAIHDNLPAGAKLMTSSLETRFSEEIAMTKIKNIVTSREYLKEIFKVSKEYNIDPLLLHAIAEIESKYNPIAISPAGAKGLMQVMPDTARRFGMQNPETELLDPESNLRISSNYLRSLYDLFGNNLTLILAAYNAGENAVIKYGYTIPPYRETQEYVSKVMKRYLELKDRSMRF
jgi:soluble lytic murein transglycosylase-like protein